MQVRILSRAPNKRIYFKSKSNYKRLIKLLRDSSVAERVAHNH